MRIIAGDARGRTIVTPKGRLTRPTQDYVRESLFSIIQRDVPNAAVLDLFAGSGALALEALSRGAANAVLADKSRQAIECIRRNVETLGYSDRAVILQGEWQAVVKRIPETQHGFDLVFLDPPYDLATYADMAEMLRSRRLLKEDALIVIEHHKDVAVELSPLFAMKDCRTYGDTLIHLFTFGLGGKTDG
jgi:16S rRNA (guanine966-N2)-methyltransferase